MLPHESTSSSSSFLPSSSSSSALCAETTEPKSEAKPVIKVEDEIQFNSTSQVEFEFDVEVKVKVEEDLNPDKEKEKEEDIFQQLSQILNEPDAECTNKIRRTFEPQNVEFEFKQEEEDVWMDESDHNIPIVNPSESNFNDKKSELSHKISIIIPSNPTSTIPVPSRSNSNCCNFGPFKCSESGCEYSTNTEYRLKLHGYSRHGKREDLEIFTCSLCPYKTPHHHILEQHVDNVHVRPETFACHLCPFKTKTEQILQTHVNCFHLNLRPYKCPETRSGCDYAAKEYVSFKQHMRAAHKKSVQEINEIWKSVFRSSNLNNSSAPQFQSKSKSGSQAELSTKLTTNKIPPASKNVQAQSKSNLKPKVKSCKIVTVILYECENCEFRTKRQKQIAAHLYNQHNLPRVKLQR